jgi:hypothetical protein
MNHDSDHLPGFDDPQQEHEWLAQENAMRRERLHLDPAGDNARSQRYRLLARTLRTAPADGLPADFAQQMSARVSTAEHTRTPALTFERLLTKTLIGALVLAAATVTIIYGSSWWPAFKLLLPASATSQWGLALSGCLAVNWALGRWTSPTQSRN